MNNTRMIRAIGLVASHHASGPPAAAYDPPIAACAFRFPHG
jgi:hypothetical protein